MDPREVKPTDPLRQHILEAVDCLRQRKCRPDRESIAHYVLRKFGSTMNEIFAELENIVDEGGLIKVEYKGTTSYRSPSSFDTKNSPLLTKHSKILNSSKTTRLIITGINELLAKDPNYAQIGVPLEELKQKLFEFDGLRFNIETIDVLLEREINVGSISVAKSDLLQDSLRVFPKDLTVPSDMRLVLSLGSVAIADIKEEKKPRKPRKSNLPVSDLDNLEKVEPKKPKKPKLTVKDEPSDLEEQEPGSISSTDKVFAVKSAPVPSELVLAVSEPEPTENSTPVTGKKSSRTPASGRRIIAEKVAQVIRKNYESTSAFETTSAQMIKLAEAVVNRQGEDAKVPTLVLAGSDINDESTPGPESPKGEKILKTDAAIVKKKGRTPSGNKEEIGSPKDSESSQSTDKSPTEGLTRSKRDKRKKQVFDPSDLPKTYSKYATTPKTASKKPRLVEEPQQTITSRSSAAKNTRNSIILNASEKIANISKIVVAKKAPVKRKLPSKSSSQIQETDDAELKVDPPKSRRTETRNGSNLNKMKEETSETCDYCADAEQPKGTNEEILTCSTCHTKVHPSCMGYATEMSQRLLEFCSGNSKRKLQWQCVECKTCGICKEKIVSEPSTSHTNGSTGSDVVEGRTDALKVLLCENCDAGFHTKCIAEDSKEAWICSDCKESDEKIETGGNGKVTRTTAKSGKSPQPIKNLKQRKQEAAKSSEQVENEDEPLDIRSWNTEDVENYFTSKGLKDEGAILRQQEVDGSSLLLLQREDIINGMGFRLGPALKVYRLIYELQFKAPVKPKPAAHQNDSPNAQSPSQR